MKDVFIVVIFISVLSGCGVKGDPLPPEKPTEIGRGRPTYKKAVQKIKLQEPEDEEEQDEAEKE